jgi:hypothetical protein
VVQLQQRLARRPQVVQLRLTQRRRARLAQRQPIQWRRAAHRRTCNDDGRDWYDGRDGDWYDGSDGGGCTGGGWRTCVERNDDGRDRCDWRDGGGWRDGDERNDDGRDRRNGQLIQLRRVAQRRQLIQWRRVAQRRRTQRRRPPLVRLQRATNGSHGDWRDGSGWCNCD